MKTKKTITLFIATTMVLGLMSFSILHSGGQADSTGSPADGSATCAESGCHSDFALNTGGGSVAISTSPLITAGYAPGAIYTISITVTKTGQSLFAFDFEALKSNNTDAGALAVLNGETQIMAGTNANNMSTADGGIAGAGAHTFTFKWTAPAIGTGTVTLYAAGNAADADGGTGGDYIYTSSLILTEGAPLGVAENYYSNSEITVYPNPASDNISIKTTSNESLKVIMCDLEGRETLNSADISDQNTNFSVLNIANGSYILKVYNEKGLLKTDKIVVMH